MVIRLVNRGMPLGLVCVLAAGFLLTSPAWADASAGVGKTAPDPLRGVYLTSSSFGDRKITEIVHYGRLCGLNGVVLHVKEPFGYVHWQSKQARAVKIGAVKGDGRLERAVARLKKEGFWVAGKLDLFQDDLLAQEAPDLALLDTKTGKPWANRRGLRWANPADERVWDYNIALAKELAGVGVDEVQFDYVRFPSDGDLSRITYPEAMGEKTAVIGAFLKKAKAALKPLGVVVTVDVFGLVAWKTDDFGVGQRLEDMAPHVDAVCPMLYPSHFPERFFGEPNAATFPHDIMERSMKRLAERSKVRIVPWVQGFWYKPGEIIAQWKGLEAAGMKSWLMWSPSSTYTVTYEAFEERLGKAFPLPKYYPTLEELAKGGVREVQGVGGRVHWTDYGAGRTVLWLEGPVDGKASRYGNPTSLLKTLDEAVMDQILALRGVEIGERATGTQKVGKLLGLMCRDLGVKANRMRPQAIGVDWRGNGRFVAGDGVERQEKIEPRISTDRHG